MSQVKFNFFLKNNPNNKRELPIVMTITMSGERTQMFTGLWTIRSKWNNKYNKVIGTDPESKSINDTLLSLTSRGRQVVNELVVSGRPFNPNPVYDKLFINPLNDSQFISYNIIETTGRIIKSGDLDSSNGFATIDMETLKAGVYIIQLYDGKNKEQRKFIKS